MSNFEYYLYSTQWDNKNQRFKGWVAEFPYLTAHGSSLGRALNAIKKKVNHELERLAQAGEEIPEPLSIKNYSGKLILRMSETLHRKLAQEATQDGVSLNQFINLKLAQDLDIQES